MNLLVDTHILLWMLNEPERLSSVHRSLLGNPDHTLLISAVTLCEISIKFALGKLKLPAPPDLFFPPHLEQPGMQILPVLASHAFHLYQLPLHHRDPFDRILIAQAIVEKLPLLTADPQFRRYPVRIL